MREREQVEEAVTVRVPERVLLAVGVLLGVPLAIEVRLGEDDWVGVAEAVVEWVLLPVPVEVAVRERVVVVVQLAVMEEVRLMVADGVGLVV